MNCVAFERWLDEGDVAQVPAEWAAHVAACERCTRALASARALESALGTHFSSEPAATPVHFTARVLERIDAFEAQRAPATFVSEALPWWVRVASEPTVVGASLIAAVLLWQGDAIVAMGRSAIQGLARVPVAEAASGRSLADGLSVVLDAFKPVPGADWTVAIAIALGLAPVFGLAGYGLWRLVERWVGSPAVGPRFAPRAGS